MIHIGFENSKPRNRWQRTSIKRGFNLQWCNKIKPVAMTAISMGGKAIVVVILLAYVGAVFMFFWSL